MKKPRYPCGAERDPNELVITNKPIKMRKVEHINCRCVITLEKKKKA